MKIKISVTRRTRYTSYVEMTKAEYKRLCSALDDDTGQGAYAAELAINEMVDPNDWMDDELDDIDCFEAATK